MGQKLRDRATRTDTFLLDGPEVSLLYVNDCYFIKTRLKWQGDIKKIKPRGHCDWPSQQSLEADFETVFLFYSSHMLHSWGGKKKYLVM